MTRDERVGGGGGGGGVVVVVVVVVGVGVVGLGVRMSIVFEVVLRRNMTGNTNQKKPIFFKFDLGGKRLRDG